MSYKGIKTVINDIMTDLGFSAAKEAFDFEDAGSDALDDTYIVSVLEGAQLEPSNEELNTAFYDTQQWQILIGFSKSDAGQIEQRDEMQVKRESIVKALDNPDNWESITDGPTVMKYQTWGIEEMNSYFLLKITLKIIDRNNY